MRSKIVSGDLLFVVSSDEAESAAIASATKQDEDITFTHVGIAVNTSGVVEVIDATPSRGVARRALADFIADAPKIGGGVGVVVKSVSCVSANAVVDRAVKLIGKPYNRYFYPDADGYYCSQLVYECYRDEKNCRIFSAVDMNFYDEAGKLHPHWIELFGDNPIPQGLPGTNPNALSREPVLSEKLRLF